MMAEAVTFIPVWDDYTVLPANVYDSLMGTDKLDVAVVEQANIDFGALQKTSLGAATPALSATGVDAIWDEVVNTGHTVANSAAKLITDNLNAPVATVDTVVDGIATDVAAVHVHVGTIDGHITADYGAAEKTCIDLLDDAAGGLADIHTDVAAVKSDTAAIKAKTDNLPADPADDSDIDAQLATIAGYLDTEVAAIKAKTDNLPASPAAVGSAMTLADDAITAAKFDETTAFPLTQADAAATAVARTSDGSAITVSSGKVKLAADGLDSVDITEPAGVAANFREMVVQVWRRFFKKAVINMTDGTLKCYKDDGFVATTQVISEAANMQTQEVAT
jgi:hypothetical protein